MSEQTGIQWCDSTHNFWRGCKAVSAGCANCYAKKQVERFVGDFAQRVRSKDFNAPLRWNKKPAWCEHCGFTTWDNHSSPDPGTSDKGYCDSLDDYCEVHTRRVFSLSLGDWLDPEVPVEWLADMLDVIRRCDQLEWILCTKRPELWRDRMVAVQKTGSREDGLSKDNRDTSGGHCVAYDWLQHSFPPKTVTFLVSVEDQPSMDERREHLLNIPATRRGLSIEPLLGPIDLGFFKNSWRASWVIVGGESGPNARLCDVAWIRSIVQQCKAAQVPCFVKQLGTSACQNERVNGGCKSWEAIPLKHPKGGDPAEWPEDLRVREFPQ